MDQTPGSVNHQSPPLTKTSLFRSLFRGRDNVYPRRFESRKTGKSGHQPACANEWARGLCEKPAVKCPQCPHRRFLPVTDEAIRRLIGNLIWRRGRGCGPGGGGFAGRGRRLARLGASCCQGPLVPPSDCSKMRGVGAVPGTD